MIRKGQVRPIPGGSLIEQFNHLATYFKRETVVKLYDGFEFATEPALTT